MLGVVGRRWEDLGGVEQGKVRGFVVEFKLGDLPCNMFVRVVGMSWGASAGATAVLGARRSGESYYVTSLVCMQKLISDPARRPRLRLLCCRAARRRGDAVLLAGRLARARARGQRVGASCVRRAEALAACER